MLVGMVFYQSQDIFVPPEYILRPFFYISCQWLPDCVAHSHAIIDADDTSQDFADKYVNVMEGKLKEDIVNYIFNGSYNVSYEDSYWQ